MHFRRRTGSVTGGARWCCSKTFWRSVGGLVTHARPYWSKLANTKTHKHFFFLHTLIHVSQQLISQLVLFYYVQIPVLQSSENPFDYAKGPAHDQGCKRHLKTTVTMGDSIFLTAIIDHKFDTTTSVALVVMTGLLRSTAVIACLLSGLFFYIYFLI